MKTPLAASLVSAACLAAMHLAAPAAAAPARDGAKPIQLIDADGKAVSQLFVRDGYEGYDVLDLSHVLLRTPHHQFFVVTFDKPCDWMDYVNNFRFSPEIAGWVRETDVIDARSYKGGPCPVTHVQQVASADAGRALAKKAAGG